MNKRIRLDYLDGIRAIAALSVVLTHAILRWPAHGLSRIEIYWLGILNYGQYAVPVFIALSGYCLMLPVARARDGRLPGGTAEFLQRRARRILPPYYAAVAGALFLSAAIPYLHTPSGTTWDSALPQFSAGPLCSHLLMLQVFVHRWEQTINPPLWTVSLEWWIYFLFPLALLPLWRRAGTVLTVVIAFAVSLFLRFMLPVRIGAAAIHFEYIGIFAAGMAAAVLGWSSTPRHVWWRERLPWGIVGGGGWLVLVFIVERHQIWAFNIDHYWATHILAGISALCLMIFLTRHQTRAAAGCISPLPLLLRLLEFRPLVWIGTFSYSIYLIHFPILALCFIPLFSLHLSATTLICIMLFLVSPSTIAIAYGFHLVFERPFMSKPAPRTERRAEVAAVVSPAP